MSLPSTENTTSATGNLADILREQARRRPDQPAIIDTHRGHKRVTTFAELERRVGQAAALLWDAGLRPGDTVLALQPMSAELYVALIAIFRSGLTAMFVDPSAGVAQVERCCALFPPQGFIGSPRAHLLRLLAPSVGRIPCKFVIGAFPRRDPLESRQPAYPTRGDRRLRARCARSADLHQRQHRPAQGDAAVAPLLAGATRRAPRQLRRAGHWRGREHDRAAGLRPGRPGLWYDQPAAAGQSAQTGKDRSRACRGRHPALSDRAAPAPRPRSGSVSPHGVSKRR